MNHLEFKLHCAILKHIRSAFIGAHNPNLKIFHVANETKDASQAYWNKVLGIEPGASDLFAGWNGNTGVMEIKAPDGKLTGSQNKFLSWASAVGWHTGIARSVKQAHHILCTWGLKAAHQSIIEPDYSTQAEKFQRAHEWLAP